MYLKALRFGVLAEAQEEEEAGAEATVAPVGRDGQAKPVEAVAGVLGQMLPISIPIPEIQEPGVQLMEVTVELVERVEAEARAEMVERAETGAAEELET
jgi:hypothetical protein